MVRFNVTNFEKLKELHIRVPSSNEGEANELWLDFSNSRCAGWLIVCEELLTDCFMEYVENWQDYYVYNTDSDSLERK